MFKRLLCIVFAFSLGACSSEPAEDTPSTGTQPAKPAVTELWNVTDGIDVPESVYKDPQSGDIYVSLIVGMPDQKDGNGRIARISADGKTVDAMWVTGLNAPKGIRTYQGTLWTADIDEIVGIDIATAQTTSKVKVKDAQFLNDVAIGSDGTVYASDTLASRIYALRGGNVSVFAEGEDVDYPNGLLVDGDSLVVGGWGKPDADFSTKVPGHLLKFDLKTKTRTLITPEPIANIDGVDSDGKGGYIASDYNAGKILHISADGNVTTLTTFMPGTADISFVPADNLLLVPHMNENKIAAYDISDVLQ